MKELLTSLPFQEMEPDTYKGDGRNLFCLRKGSEIYLYLMTPAWKDHDMLYVGPPPFAAIVLKRKGGRR